MFEILRLSFQGCVVWWKLSVLTDWQNPTSACCVISHTSQVNLNHNWCEFCVAANQHLNKGNTKPSNKTLLMQLVTRFESRSSCELLSDTRHDLEALWLESKQQIKWSENQTNSNYHSFAPRFVIESKTVVVVAHARQIRCCCASYGQLHITRKTFQYFRCVVIAEMTYCLAAGGALSASATSGSFLSPWSRLKFQKFKAQS